MNKGILNKKLKVVLDDIYSWCGINENLSESEIIRRELVLWKQALLYKIEDAKRKKDRKVGDFNSALLEVLDSCLV